MNIHQHSEPSLNEVGHFSHHSTQPTRKDEIRGKTERGSAVYTSIHEHSERSFNEVGRFSHHSTQPTRKDEIRGKTQQKSTAYTSRHQYSEPSLNGVGRFAHHSTQPTRKDEIRGKTQQKSTAYTSRHQYSEPSLNEVGHFSHHSTQPTRKDEIRGKTERGSAVYTSIHEHSERSFNEVGRFSRRLSGGFTLIEMLLVIALLSLITSFGILAYRTNAADNRMNKVSLETQNILAAAMTYRSDHGDWPTAHDESDCSTSEPDTADSFVTDYLPNESAQTTYGGYYCWGVNTSNSLFWVALETPNADSNLAKRIAATLPNAIDTTSPSDAAQQSCSENSDIPCYVRAEVAQVNASSSTSSSTLAGMGYCDPSDAGATVSGSSDDVTCRQNTAERDQYIVSFYCPSDEIGSVFVSPNFYGNPGGNSNVTANLTHLSAAGSKVDTCSAQAVNGLMQWTCTINLVAQYDGTNNVVNAKHLSNGTIGATYSAFCKTVTTSSKRSNIYHY